MKLFQGLILTLISKGSEIHKHVKRDNKIENGVMMTLKHSSMLSLILTCLCNFSPWGFLGSSLACKKFWALNRGFVHISLSLGISI